MSVKVRCFAIEGMIAGAISSYGGRNSENAIWLPKMPYLNQETLTVDTTASATGTDLSTSQHANMVMVEVEAGKRVRYEISTKNATTRDATQDSPVIYGESLVAFGQGYRISFIEDGDSA